MHLPQAEKLVLELSQTRDELSRRIAAATDGADAMLANAAGAMNMLNVRARVPFVAIITMECGGCRTGSGLGLGLGLARVDSRCCKSLRVLEHVC